MHTREIIAMLYNINRGKNVSAKKGKDLIPLSIDEKIIEQEPLTQEEQQEIVKKFSRFIKN